MTLRVGVDLDGVLYNFGESVQRYLEATGRGFLWKSGPTPKPFWDFYKDWGWNGSEFVEFCNDGADAGVIFCGPARQNASAAINIIKKMGHKIIIITDRGFGATPEVSQNHTRNWLRQHNIPYDELHFSADKTIAPTDIFVEDKIENYDALTAAGTECWLIDRAWNQLDEPDDRNRIRDIMDYPTKVEAKAKRLISVD